MVASQHLLLLEGHSSSGSGFRVYKQTAPCWRAATPSSGGGGLLTSRHLLLHQPMMGFAASALPGHTAAPHCTLNTCRAACWLAPPARLSHSLYHKAPRLEGLTPATQGHGLTPRAGTAWPGWEWTQSLLAACALLKRTYRRMPVACLNIRGLFWFAR